MPFQHLGPATEKARSQKACSLFPHLQIALNSPQISKKVQLWSTTHSRNTLQGTPAPHQAGTCTQVVQVCVLSGTAPEANTHITEQYNNSLCLNTRVVEGTSCP